MTSRVPLGVAGLLGAVLAGCVSVGPDYRAPEVAVPAEWPPTSVAAAPPGARPPAELARWWDGLGDSLLTALIEEALGANPDLKGAQAALRGARASRALAAAGRFPALSASGGVSRQHSLGADTTLYQAGLDASWEPDVFGGTRRALEAAEADAAASLADLRATQVSLAGEVALSYVDVRAYQSRLAIARDNLASQSETLQITDWRAQAGLVSGLDVEQARSNRDSTLAAIPALESGLAQAEHRLATLTGRPPGSLHGRLAVAEGRRTGLLPAVPEGLALGIPADTLRQRPDVVAAERRLAAETARVGQAEAALYPSFSLSGSLGLQALGLSTFSGGGQIARSLAAAVSGPVLDAGRGRARVEVQDALRAQRLAAYEATVLAALEDVHNALAALASGQARRQALASAAAAARNAALLARHRYTSGVVDFQTVLSTERTLLTLEDSLASAEGDQVSALVRLYKALGGGWSALPDAALNPDMDGRQP